MKAERFLGGAMVDVEGLTSFEELARVVREHHEVNSLRIRADDIRRIAGAAKDAEPQSESGAGLSELEAPPVSRRDYFAAAALTGLLAKGTPGGAEWYAQQAYEYADAMLAAGKVGP